MVEPLFGVLDLPVHEPEALDDDPEMGRGGVDRSGRGGNGGLAQPAEHLDGVEAADAMALQQALDGRRPHTRRLGGRRHALPEVEKPGGGPCAVS